MSEKEIRQWMTTGLTRSEAIEEIKYWQAVSNMLKVRS